MSFFFSITSAIIASIIGYFIAHFIEKSKTPNTNLDHENNLDIIEEPIQKSPIWKTLKDNLLVGTRGLFWGILLGFTAADFFNFLPNGLAVLILPPLFAVAGFIIRIVLHNRKENL